MIPTLAIVQGGIQTPPGYHACSAFVGYSKRCSQTMAADRLLLIFSAACGIAWHCGCLDDISVPQYSHLPLADSVKEHRL